jgi:hypothetical protein
MDRPIAPSLLSVVIFGELLVEPVTEWDDA